MNEQALCTYREAMEITGLPERTFFRRLTRRDVRVFIDGRDTRRRLIARADLPKLIQPEEVEHNAESAA